MEAVIMLGLLPEVKPNLSLHAEGKCSSSNKSFNLVFNR
jgi:hypothetical protein